MRTPVGDRPSGDDAGGDEASGGRPGRGVELDSAAGFADAVAPHLGVMAQVARRMLATDADDVVQDALLAAWRYRARFDPDRGTLRTWLVAITISQSRRAGRRSTRWRRAVARLGPAQAAVVVPESGDARLEDAIADLTERQRAVVDLHYFVDLSVADVAAALGISVGTVKSTLSDARGRIRRHLSDRESGDPDQRS